MSCGSRGPGQRHVDGVHELARRARPRRSGGTAPACRSRRPAARRCARRAWCAPRRRSGSGSRPPTTPCPRRPACAGRAGTRRRTARSVVSALPLCTTTSVLDASFIRPRAPQPSSRLRALGRVEQPGPQRLGGLLLGEEPVGADEAVAVRRPPVAEARSGAASPSPSNGWYSPIDGVHRVLGVAQVDAVEVGGDLALHLEVVGVPLAEVRRPRARCGTGGRRRRAASTRRC